MGVVASSNWTADNITFNLVIGFALALVQAAFTYLIVNRVTARNEERRRRVVSAFAESRVVDAADSLLALGMPIGARRISARTIAIGESRVDLQVSQIDGEILAD